MINDIINEHDMMVLCWNNDAIKVRGEYVATPEYDVYEHIKTLARLNSQYMFENRTTKPKYELSHGICPPCAEMYRTQLVKVEQ